MRERLNWVDWLKIVVVVGAFIFHSAQPFVPTRWPIEEWPIVSPDTGVIQIAVLGTLSVIGYLIGMTLMFFLAGAATWLAVERRGIGGHTGLRLRRLLIPLVLGLVLLGPPQAWIAYVASGGTAGPIEFLGIYLSRIEVYLNPRWFGDYGHHLWFLAFLFMYVALTVPLLSWLRSRRAAGAELYIGAVAESRFGLVWLLLPIIAVQLVLRPLFPEYRDWADFGLWLCYFIIGIGAMADSRVMPAILRRGRITLWCVPLAILGFLPAVLNGSPLDLEHDPGFSVVGVAYVAWRTTAAWIGTLVLVGLAATYLTARPRFLGWASGMVLPFYVLHHPVTVGVAAVVVGLSLGGWVEFGLILLVAGALTVGLCMALDVGTSWIGGRFTRTPASTPASAEVPR